MSEELCYSSVLFTTPYNSSAAVPKNEETPYAEVKKAELAPAKSDPVLGDSSTTGQETGSPAQAPQKTGHRYQPQQWAVVFLSLICAFLLAGIIALSVFYYLSQSSAGQLKKENSAFVETNKQLQELNRNLTAQKESQESEISNLTAQKESQESEISNLTAQKKSLESENTQLLKDRTLLARRCSPCPGGWTFNNSKCYFVSPAEDKTWKTWNESRHECIKMGADLLTIQNEEEQTFIMNLAPRYFDQWHGYWIGLTKQASGWIWVNGSSLTTGFWAGAGSQVETYVLTNAGYKDKTLNSWIAAKPDMCNRWICENKALLF